MRRKPRGFTSRDVSRGVLYFLEEEDGRWVILAADPKIKIDNKHTDHIPHMHTEGWNSEIRRDLKPTLTLHEAADAIEHYILECGFIPVENLLEELR